MYLSKANPRMVSLIFSASEQDRLIFVFQRVNELFVYLLYFILFNTRELL